MKKMIVTLSYYSALPTDAQSLAFIELIIENLLQN